MYGKRVLVVDDNSTNRHVLLTQLQQWKFDPVLTSSGEEALKIFSGDSRIELIITDMQMPGMDGIGFAKGIRKKNTEVPIILLSSVGDEQRKYYEDLFSYVLTKPVKQKTLSKAITDSLRRQIKPKSQISTIERKLSVDFAQKYPLNILIAEDNPTNQRLASRTLEKLGHQVVIVENGMLAIKAFDVAFYNLFLWMYRCQKWMVIKRQSIYVKIW